jgi:hypothetical protein
MIERSDGVLYGVSTEFADVRGVEESIAALTATLDNGEREYLL